VVNISSATDDEYILAQNCIFWGDDFTKLVLNVTSTWSATSSKGLVHYMAYHDNLLF